MPDLVLTGMRTLMEIRREIERPPSSARTLGRALGGHDTVKSAEAARLSRRIEALWAEARVARARARYGPSDEIITRARAHDRLDREARRWREAA